MLLYTAQLLVRITMPKMKTKRAAAKRFGVTGTGKFTRRKQNLRHILTKKNAKRKMNLGQGALVDKSNEKACRRMMPYA
ncbi:MAG: 50S ribosomal protein L35 [Thiotrichaceae bacterium]